MQQEVTNNVTEDLKDGVCFQDGSKMFISMLMIVSFKPFRILYAKFSLNPEDRKVHIFICTEINFLSYV